MSHTRRLFPLLCTLAVLTVSACEPPASGQNSGLVASPPVTTTSTLTTTTTTSEPMGDPAPPPASEPGVVPADAIWVGPDGEVDGAGTRAEPMDNIQYAIDRAGPGGAVVVKAGDYSLGYASLGLQHGGTTESWFTLMAEPGTRPRIITDGANGAYIGATRVEIRGFELVGNGSSARPHGTGVFLENAQHVRVIDNVVTGFGASGIATIGGTGFHIEGNEITGNAKWSHYQTSAISIYLPNGVTSTTDHENIIRNNVVFGNETLVPVQSGYWNGTITDGNCIIVDSSRVHAYTGRTLIENNLCVDNGGRGVHIYDSDHVDVVHNTSYRNSTTVGLAGGGGEITLVDASDITVRNNVGVNRPGAPRPPLVVERVSNADIANNVWVTPGSVPTIGAGDVVVTAEQFVAPGLDPRFADFSPRADSAIIDAAGTGGSVDDLYGRSRTTDPDIGAIERRDR